MTTNPKHENHKLCEQLKENEKCFRLFEYNQGLYAERFHEHIQSHRMSSDSAYQFMKALILKHSPYGDYQMLQAYMNSRGGEPRPLDIGKARMTQPDQRVFRTYLDSGQLLAWCDTLMPDTEKSSD